MDLIYILIVIFVVIIVSQIFLGKTSSLIEGMDSTTPTTTTTPTTSYEPYNLNDPNSALILSQQNAGNIDFLKGRVDELANVKKDVDDLKQNVSLMQTQIDGLVQQQADFGTQLAGSEPPSITGTEEVTPESATAITDEEDK
jgi:hypothetical protein